MFDIKKFFKGLQIIPKTTLESDTQGELEVSNVDGKLNYHDGLTRSPVVTEDSTATLQNKTIDSADNTITVDADEATVSNLEVDNLKTGVLDTDTTLATASDTKIPSSLAVKTYVDNVAANQNEASEISYDNSTSGLTATDVQAAIDEVEGRVDTAETNISTNASNLTNHLNDTTDAHDASAISFDNVASGLTATDVQAAVDEVEGRLDTAETNISTNASNLTDHLNDTTDAHDASAISVVPAGNLAADDVQEALEELQTDVDTRALDSDLTTHTGATSGVHGVTGDVVGTTDTQTLTNKTIQGASIESPARLDPKKDTKANLDTYATTAQNGELVFATDEKKSYQVIDTVLSPIGSGGGGLDIYYTQDMESLADVSGFTTGNNATFLNGGSLAGTLALDEATPIAGGKTLKYTQATGSLNDYFASEVIDIEAKQQNNDSGMTLYFEYDGNDDDLKWVVWDETNSTELTSGVELIKTAGRATRYALSFHVPVTCTEIRWGAQVLVENDGAVLLVDDVEMSTNPFAYAETIQTQIMSVRTNTTTGMTATSGTLRWGSLVEDEGPSAGLLRYEDATGRFFLLKPATISASLSLRNSGSLGQFTIMANKNGVNTNIAYLDEFTASYNASAAGEINLNVGDYLWFTSNHTLVNGATQTISIYATASNPSILTPSDTFSTDTAPLTYAGSSEYTLSTLANAPIGTFITFTYAINTNTRSQTNAAPPTQTTSSMNQNGIQIFGRAYNAASTSGNPAAIAVQIGKGLKGFSLELYKSTGKSIAGELDGFSNANFSAQYGFSTKNYDSTTGVLYIDAAEAISSGNTSRDFKFSDATTQNNGYIVVNAGKTLPLLAVPVPQVAYLKDVKPSGTAGGTFTAGSWQTRDLNTVEGDSGFVSLSANAFTLQPGKYLIEASAPAYRVLSHKCKVRNISDSQDNAIGSSSYSVNNTDADQTFSFVSSQLILTSSKVFEIQHQAGATQSGDGFGTTSSFGVDEVYTTVKITRLG